jgi:hypothetical protein
MNKLVALLAAVCVAAPAVADGYTDCTKEPKEKWKPKEEAEAIAKTAGYEVRRSKIEGACYEVYGVDKTGQLYELFYSPVDMTLKHTIKK